MKNNNSTKNNFSILVENLLRNLSLIDKNEKCCCGITMPQTYAIQAIAKNKKYTMKDLSSQMGVAKSTVTRIINVLVRDGLVKRARDEKDRRKVYIELTSKGKQISGKLKACYEGYIEQIFSQVPEKKKKDMINSLKMLDDAIKSVKGKCC